MILSVLLEEFKKEPSFVLEGLLYDLACELKKIMEEKGVTKKELAERLGVSPAYITKIFSGYNISLKTVARILAALEADVKLTFVDREAQTKPKIEKNLIKLIDFKGIGDEGEIFSLAS